MYDPIVGRFLEQDPLGLAGGDTNLYRYVNNSPLNGTDPLGLSTVVSYARYTARSVRVATRIVELQRLLAAGRTIFTIETRVGPTVVQIQPYLQQLLRRLAADLVLA